MNRVKQFVIGLCCFVAIGVFSVVIHPLWIQAEDVSSMEIESQEEVKSQIHEITRELSIGFDLVSEVKKEQLSARLFDLNSQLASDFFVFNNTAREIKVFASYLNQAGDQWITPEHGRQVISPGKMVKVFEEMPLFGSDRTIFVETLPFMFMCSSEKFATVAWFRRGGIVFPLSKPDTKLFDYQDVTYAVSWKQGENKAAGVFDIVIEAQDAQR